ncbi:MAG: hypothetical protein AABY14_03250 [Nanoarchaeota archaeon]
MNCLLNLFVLLSAFFISLFYHAKFIYLLVLSPTRKSLGDFLVGDAHRQSLWHLLVKLGDIGGYKSFSGRNFCD